MTRAAYDNQTRRCRAYKSRRHASNVDASSASRYQPAASGRLSELYADKTHVQCVILRAHLTQALVGHLQPRKRPSKGRPSVREARVEVRATDFDPFLILVASRVRLQGGQLPLSPSLARQVWGHNRVVSGYKVPVTKVRHPTSKDDRPESGLQSSLTAMCRRLRVGSGLASE